MIILGMGLANERRRYFVTPFLIGRDQTQEDQCLLRGPPLYQNFHINLDTVFYRSVAGLCRWLSLQCLVSWLNHLPLLCVGLIFGNLVQHNTFSGERDICVCLQIHIFISSWYVINNHMSSIVCNEITYPFPKFKSCTVEVWEGHVISSHT